MLPLKTFSTGLNGVPTFTYDLAEVQLQISLVEIRSAVCLI